MKQEKSRTGEDAEGGGGTPCLRTNYRPWVGEESLCESGVPVSGTLDLFSVPSPNCAVGLVGATSPTGIPKLGFGRWWGNRTNLSQFTFRINKVCACIWGEGGDGEGHVSLGALAIRKWHPIPAIAAARGLWMVSLIWPWVLAVLTSCFLPSSASSTEFPSSESLGWLVSAHLGFGIFLKPGYRTLRGRRKACH